MPPSTAARLAAFVGLTLSGAAVQAAIEGEVAYLFDQINSNGSEIVIDATSNGRDGTLRPGTSTSDLTLSTDTPFAYSGNMSLSLAGDLVSGPGTLDDHVSLTQPMFSDDAVAEIGLGTGDFTIEAWVKVNANHSSVSGCQACGIFYSADVPLFSEQSIQFRTHDGALESGQLQFIIQDNVIFPEVVGATTVAAGVWQHVAAILDRTGVHGTANMAYVFLNGVQDGALDVTGLGTVLADGSHALHNSYAEYVGAGATFGGGTFPTDTEFSGLIDEFRIVNRALTLAELQVRQTTSLGDTGRGIRGDFNGSGVVDTADIDLLCAELNGSNANFDLNNDGMVNQLDADELILVILGTEYGDADLTSGATLADLGTVATNFGSIRTDFGWADGDFNWDGMVTLVDLGILAANFGDAGPPMGIPGDFDGSGVVDAVDIDLLCGQLGPNVPPADEKFDLNGDGMVNSEDADKLVLDILGTEYGDADLMGGATLGDLGTLAGNFTSTRTDFGWADGDFNWDGEVTLADLGILAANFGSNGPIPQAEFEAAVEAAFGAPLADLVPEPGTASIVVLCSLGLLSRRR